MELSTCFACAEKTGAVGRHSGGRQNSYISGSVPPVRDNINYAAVVKSSSAKTPGKYSVQIGSGDNNTGGILN